MNEEFSYGHLLGLFFRARFTRIERDDRLLDIFPAEDREKGIELWEKWELATVHLVRVRIPFTIEALKLYRFGREEMEALLQKNIPGKLGEYSPVAEGADVTQVLLEG